MSVVLYKQEDREEEKQIINGHPHEVEQGGSGRWIVGVVYRRWGEEVKVGWGTQRDGGHGSKT